MLTAIIIAFVIVIVFAFWLARKAEPERDNRRKTNKERRARIAEAEASEREYQRSLDESWEDIELPEHRPPGKWVLWKHMGGRVKIKGTSKFREEISGFRYALEDMNQEDNSITVQLVRDPNNSFDPNAIEVHADVSGAHGGTFMLGFVDADAAEWLADNYCATMPISAFIDQMATNYEHTSITLAPLMPAKKERAKYEL